jgi:4-hydroxy-tetrahydrodipicolinate reductase
MALKVQINGASGRMGHALVACAKEIPDLTVSATTDAGDSFSEGLSKSDACIDFSHHSALETVLDAAVAQKKPLVIGTTGISDAGVAKIVEAAKQIPIVYSGNYSTGVNTLLWLTRKAAEILGPDFDLEVIETHHRMKKDAPSGTAKMLAETLAEVRELQYNDDVRHGRFGDVGARTSTEIGMHAVRGGDVVGDHTVIFAALGERVELTHKASSRDIFARGALRACQWVSAKPAGLYDMRDVLGLK